VAKSCDFVVFVVVVGKETAEGVSEVVLLHDGVWQQQVNYSYTVVKQKMKTITNAHPSVYIFLNTSYKMEVLQESSNSAKHSFISHVFSTTDEDKGELLNVVQYSLMGVLPVVVLNKLIQRFVPEADPDKSSVELLVEIMVQLIVIFGSLIFIHRMITFVPTYSGFKYEHLVLTNVVLAFLVIVLSIQSKIGLKTNILFDRVNEMWNGPSEDGRDEKKNGVRVRQPLARHAPSQADYLDNSMIQNDMFPPAPVANPPTTRGAYPEPPQFNAGPMPANGILGGSFGSSF